MKVRRTKVEDISAILAIVEEAKEYLKSQKIDQWQNGYPNEKVILQDIHNQESYVLEEGAEILGCMCLSFRKEPTYQKIEGEWLNNREYGVLHRLAVKSSWKGKSLANYLLQDSENQARKEGVAFLRIDTHPENESMKRWIEKMGFCFCGRIYLEDGAKRLAYEKKVREHNEV